MSQIVSLVTGGAGFMGSHVARHCLRAGHAVVVLDDLSGGFVDQVPPGAIFVEGSITDGAFVSRLFEQYKFDFIYHLAAYAAEGLSHFIRCFNYDTNVIGSVHLVNAAVRHGVRCFVFTSSIAVYGAGQLPMIESAIPQPEDPYGIAKYAVELDLAAAKRIFGLDFIIFRPHNVYGEHQNIGDRYRNVIGIFMSQLLRGEPLTIFGDGTQTRAFTYIDDVAPLIAQSVAVPEAYNQVINVGADHAVSVNTLAEMVGQAFGVKPRITHLPGRSEVAHAYADHAKAIQIFGQPSIVRVEDGIARMARWARERGARESRPFTNIEIRQNLPAGW